MADYLDQLKTAAVDSLTGGDVRVYLKTNIAPPIPIYTGTGEGSGLLDTLGVKGGIIVTNKTGKTLYTAGAPESIDLIRAGLFWATAGLIGAALLRGLLK